MSFYFLLAIFELIVILKQKTMAFQEQTGKRLFSLLLTSLFA